MRQSPPGIYIGKPQYLLMSGMNIVARALIVASGLASVAALIFGAYVRASGPIISGLVVLGACIFLGRIVFQRSPGNVP